MNVEGIDGVSVIEGVAVRRGLRIKGGDLDLEKAAHIFLQDYRTGLLGRISLETPESRVELLATFQPPPSLSDVEGEPEEAEEESPDEPFVRRR
jgi:ribosome biogenesis GTPase A